MRMEFKRGDGITHYFSVPTDSYSATDTLHFMAKPAFDDDTTDASAVIEGTFTSADAEEVGENMRYTCYFPPSATNDIDTNGAAEVRYLGEFELIDSSNVPTTFPGGKKKIDVRLYADIRRGNV